MILRMQHTFSFLVLVLAFCAIVPGADGGARDTSRDTGASGSSIRGEDHYVMRDGLRIYLWEKHKAGLEGTFANNGKVALLVHGGTWSGRPLFDLQIRDYSLMDFLAENGYDVWAIDLHGIVASCTPCDASVTVSRSGHIVALMRLRNSLSSASGTLT